MELAGGSLARWSGHDSGRLSKVGNPTEMVREVRGVIEIGRGALWLTLLVRPYTMGLAVDGRHRDSSACTEICGARQCRTGNRSPAKARASYGCRIASPRPTIGSPALQLARRGALPLLSEPPLAPSLRVSISRCPSRPALHVGSARNTPRSACSLPLALVGLPLVLVLFPSGSEAHRGQARRRRRSDTPLAKMQTG